ncbi:MAG: hypothetical protein Kow0090_06320 [Myxococcota bacterium]
MTENDNREKDDPKGEQSGWRAKIEGMVPEMVKKTLSIGVSGFLFSEEGIKNLVSELKLPKDVVTFLLAQSERTRQEIARIFAEEVRKYLEENDVAEIAREFVKDMSVEINTTIKFTYEGGEIKPEIKPQVTRKKKHGESK